LLGRVEVVFKQRLSARAMLASPIGELATPRQAAETERQTRDQRARSGCTDEANATLAPCGPGLRLCR